MKRLRNHQDRQLPAVTYINKQHIKIIGEKTTTQKKCQQCGNIYTPKSNNSKYCSRQCNNKASGQRRTQKYQTDKEYRTYLLKQKSERFKERYHNDVIFRKIHNKQTIKNRNPKKHSALVMKYYYNNHEENKNKQAKRLRDKYQNDEQYRNKFLKRNRAWQKTEPGKRANSRHRNKRRRNFKDIELWLNPFPREIEVQYHHPVINQRHNKIITIPMPKITHNYVPGVNKEKHLIHNDKWINKIYLFDINTLK